MFAGQNCVSEIAVDCLVLINKSIVTNGKGYFPLFRVSFICQTLG